MKKKVFKCGKCQGEVTDTQKFCNHCGSELSPALDKCASKRKKKLGDEEGFLGEGDGEGDLSYDPSDVYAELIDEYGDDATAFFGTENEFLKMVEELTSGEDMSEAEAVDALLQMFFSFLEDPEGFIAELESGDSVSTNKKARYVIDKLVEAGLSHGKAVAMVAYHGSLKNIRNMKDAKGLLKYKYLKDMITEKEAQKVVDYFTGKKPEGKKIAGGLADSAKQKKYICGSCKGIVNDSQKFCNHCGSQLSDSDAGLLSAIKKAVKDILGISKFEIKNGGMSVYVGGKEKYQVLPESEAKDVLENFKDYDGFPAKHFDYKGETYYFIKQ